MSSSSAAGDAESPVAAHRQSRQFSLRVYFSVLAALLAAVSAAAVGYVSVQSGDDARTDAARRSRAIAAVAAEQLAGDLRTLRSTVTNLAANPQLGTAFTKPAGCTLTFASGASGGHLDLVRPDGVVVCSSHALPAGSFAGGAGEPWVGRALDAPLFQAPARDALTGAQVARFAAPAGGRAGVVAASVALTPLARGLVGEYGRGEPIAALVTSRDGRTVLSRSLEPSRWVGSSLEGTAFEAGGSGTFRDLDGTTRIYEMSRVSGPGWRVFVGADESAVLADARTLARRQLEIIVAGLALALAGLWLVYRRVGRPVAELAAAVRATTLEAAPDPVVVRGPAEVQSLGRDVTDLVAMVRKELTAREEAEGHARDLAAIVASSHLPIFGKSLDGTITSWNDAATHLYGYTESEAMGCPVEMLVPEDRRGEAASLRARVHAGDLVDGYETVRVRKDGASVDVSLTISPIHDETGAIVGTSTISRDIGERLRAEEALRRSEESYRELFERHPVPMWLFDPDSLRFLEVNEAALRTYGYSREEFLAMTIDEIRPVEDREALRQSLGPLPSVGPEVWRHRRKDGTMFDVAITASVLDFDGRPARLILAQDVTESRRLEDQLRQAQKMEAVGRLTGGIAHDFNNLLLVIRGYSSILLAQLTEQSLRDSAQQIDDAAKRAGEFTRQLLAFSRQQVLQPEVTSLNSVVEETLRLLERTLGADIEVQTDLDPEAPAVLADRSQLTQAMLNLAINARDAMPEGGRLTIKTGGIELDEAYVATHEGVTSGLFALLQITDSGVGMDEETQRRAFDPFYTTKEDGTGLGLASVYGLVNQSGGHIWLYSEPGLGTTFKIYLPVASATVTADAPDADVTSLEGDETILLVEDTAMVRELVTATLERYGYSVLAAANGQEALDLVERTGADISLLLTDVVMPGMNGRELAETLLETRPQLGVLFTSGYPSDTVVRRGIADASAAFIEKPYLPDELAAKVREVLDRGRRA
jgi:PAS domain S-box-containing protein